MTRRVLDLYGRVEVLVEFRSPNWAIVLMPLSALSITLVRDGDEWIIARGRETIARAAIAQAWRQYVNDNPDLFNPPPCRKKNSPP